VFHELGTNAAKYGSFSRQGGAVDLSWTMRTRNDQRVLTVVWRESGGPAVTEPKTIGFSGVPRSTDIPERSGMSQRCQTRKWTILTGRNSKPFYLRSVGGGYSR
jgi:two-component sensor histidine kinase